MWNVLTSFLGDVRLETIAAIALLIQALTLWLLWRILRRHRQTMQLLTETAKLIGQALEQQTRIMDEQLRFQSRIEAKMEREKVFEAVLGLQAKVVDLTAELSPSSRFAAAISAGEEQQRIDYKWIRLEDAISPCLTGLITAIYLSPEEKNECMQFAMDLDAIARGRSLNTPQMTARGLQAISETYRDLSRKLGDVVYG